MNDFTTSVASQEGHLPRNAASPPGLVHPHPSSLRTAASPRLAPPPYNGDAVRRDARLQRLLDPPSPRRDSLARRHRRRTPRRRRREGRATRMYVVGGIRSGHGEHAMAVGWIDAYDVGADAWETGLAELPQAREYVGGEMVRGRL